ncbi:DUF6894 family protein [Sphingomonas aerophila]|jgi:hypothetical protein|uniref:DUF6894 domain-containing protein n=1 Tax=Sphingomonas aerophila TaxID=1344948 RepID=A0A7W9BHN7_9SPHN|nr:hypothetical protein [Sphingomonas aerophila]
MPRYHLHVLSDLHALDREGWELPNLELALREAVQGARELIAASILAGEPVCRQHRIEITDTEGEHLSTVRFGDLVDLRP